MIENKNKYKVTYCKITEEACTRHDCNVCVHGKAELEDELKNLKMISTFEPKSRNDVVCEVNLFNTVAKSNDINIINSFIGTKSTWLVKLEPLNEFSSDVLLKAYPHHVIVVEALKLSEASKYYYLKDSPLISIHGDVILATAPRIEDD